mgnify:CR=1 FL=1
MNGQAGSGRPSLRLSIGSIGVDGLRAGDRDVFARSFRGELTRLIDTRGVPDRVLNTGRQNADKSVFGGSVPALGPGAGRSQVRSAGIATARAVYANLGGGMGK